MILILLSTKQTLTFNLSLRIDINIFRIELRLLNSRVV